ncbi:hypothetical protein J5N97_024643 [Dioscorea zingiberensis]|uniref:Sulfite exporter TauE/SafE family protein n=1 Tax=Dioscorea zingiberensis TaxID=325984 RepID=A0A9D5H8V8_9LILI|nr:hypothetical protein J5N97_024643 [Dioscorea zingiberensis]
MDGINMGSIKSFMVYLMAASSIAVVAAFFLSTTRTPSSNSVLQHPFLSETVRVWPELELSWRSVLASVIGFLGSAFGTVGGVGGGGIFVPMLNLVVGFDTKSAAALSKCMIMGASASSVWYNLRVSHPSKEVPIIDYDLSLLFQPMLMLGITIGVELSIVFPYWLITVLIIILFLGTSSRSFFKATQMWKEETLLKMEIEKQEQAKCKSNGEDVVIGSEYEPLLVQPEKSSLEILLFNIRWKGIMVLMLVWCSFLILQILKNNASVCSTVYWAANILQLPVALSLLFCASAGLLGGTVGGLLGSGGGFILGPLLLEIGVIPQVASATATFVMMFSSSLSVIEFYFLKRFPIPYALYLITVSVMAGFWGQFFVRKLVKWLKRASIIVFILSAVIFASALTMGVVGGETSIQMIKRHEYMGFLSFCER